MPKTVSRARQRLETLCPLFWIVLVVVLGIWQQTSFLAASTNHVSLAYFAVASFTTFVSPKFGLVVLMFLLPLSPALHVQMNAIFQTSLQAASNPGLDLSSGFVGGFLLHKAIRRDIEFHKPAGFVFVVAAYAYIFCSSLMSIVRSLWQSASVTNLTGITYNLANLRSLGWHDDFFALKDLYSYSLAFAVFLCAFDILLTHQKKRDLVFIPMLISSLIVSAFAILQYFAHIGVARNGFGRGVDSFFPDLHSLAGFMLIPAIGSFYYALESRNLWVRFLCLGAGIAGFVTIVFSQSRFTFVIAIVVLIALALRKLSRPRDAKTLLGYIFVLATAVALAIFGYFKSNYIQNGLAELLQALETLQFNTLNSALSYRPELYLGALTMFSAYPILGLGQGQFYRSSRVTEFAQSNFFTRAGGENAHNYFLQTLTELGLVGFLLLALLLSIPLFKKNGLKLSKSSFWAIAAIFAGNIFAHSLLEREMLIILALFIALYFAETDGVLWRAWVHRLLSNKGPLFTRSVLFALGTVMILACVELFTSFQKTPYTFGSRCFEIARSEADGWTSGRGSFKIPETARKVDMHFDVHGHKFLKYWPLLVTYEVKDKDQNILKMATIQANGMSHILYEALEGQTLGSIDVQMSRCLVPKNVGINGDTRHLGINVKSILF